PTVCWTGVLKRKVETEEESVEGKRGKGEDDHPEIVTEVYGRNAEGVRVALLAAYPDLTVVLNPQKPRSKSFEVILFEGEKGKDVCLWSGIKKGPPRKLKFPEPEVVVSALEKALKTE
uniref:Selenoprotein H n=1 Tax=Oncorhynchus kisutch TaxID=8019 RepID=A0A8C7FCS9_ONCKI